MNTITTKEKLLLSAIDLFSRKCYSDVSVADICRTANLSNGVFYRYFKNKEEIFKLLVEELLALIKEKLKVIPGNTIETRLAQFIQTILTLTKDEYKRVSIFREGQYRFYEYEQQLQKIYRAAVNQIYGRQVTEAEYLYLLSGLRFIAYRTQFNHVPVNPDTIKQIILHGIFTNPISDYERLFSTKVIPLSVSLEENTRERLLKSGRVLFGSKDYHRVNIYEITSRLDLATGTFYKHFDSKLTFFCEIIDMVNRDIRGFINKNLDKGLNRLEQEIQGSFLFCLFLTIDKSCYNIVREAEFVINDKAKEYYDRFEQGYLASLRKNSRDVKYSDIRTVSNFLIGISHYLGIDMLFNKSARDVKELLIQLSNYLMNGISS